jgi:hypothetical protein
MAEPARLTSALLARKGQALPTGGFAHAKLALLPTQPSAAKRQRQGCDARASSGTPAAPARHPARQRAAGAGERVALTVRLDRERQSRLKILAVRGGRSCQEILLRALDVYLEVCAVDCPCLRRDGD